MPVYEIPSLLLIINDIPGLSCGDPGIVSGSGLNPQALLSPCEEGQIWTAPAGLTGDQAEVVFDLRCKQSLHRIQIANGFGDFGTDSLVVWGARSWGGKWRKLKEGKLSKRSNEVKEKKNSIFRY